MVLIRIFFLFIQTSEDFLKTQDLVFFLKESSFWITAFRFDLSILESRLALQNRGIWFCGRTGFVVATSSISSLSFLEGCRCNGLLACPILIFLVLSQ